MVSGRSADGGAHRSRSSSRWSRRRRGSVPNEAGLRSLGTTPSTPQEAGADPVANEQGLLALGTEIDKASTGRRGRRGRRGKPISRRRRRIQWVLGILGLVI